MAAVTLATGHKNQTSRRTVAKTGAALGTRRTLRISPPAIPTHSAPSSSTAPHLTLAHQAANPVFARSRARAITSAATAPYSSMLHCYKRVPPSPFSSHSFILSAFCEGSLTTRHCVFNRQPRRLESAATHTKQTTATPINRQLFSALCSANHNSPFTSKDPSNRQWQILEFTVSCTKQTPASRSNRQFLRCLDFQIPHSQKLCRTRAALEARPSTLDFQSSLPVSNRNNASFKIARNSLKINVERNPNRNTNRELRAPDCPARTNHGFHPLAHSSTCRVDRPARLTYNENATKRAKQNRAGRRCLSCAAEHGSRVTNHQSLITNHKNV
jgi:hypothetical protein